mgnify:CR=1 FL=1
MRLLLVFLVLSTAAWAEATPAQVVQERYTWVAQVDIQVSKRLPEVEQLLTPDLYDQLNRAYHLDSNQGVFLDFDPWSNSQMGAEKYTCGPAKVSGSMAKVPITVRLLHGQGKTNKYTCVLLHKSAGWQVANLVYGPKFDLMSVLKDLNKP